MSHTPVSQLIGTLQAVALTITGALPTFLTSALAVQLQDDLDFGPAALGLATSVSFAIGGLCARPMGRIVQTRGARFGFMLGSGFSALALSVVALAPSYAVLVVGLGIGGFGNAAAQPTANLLLTEVVGPGRLGLAMGIKQSYIPIASLLGGIAVPTVAVTFGWRWAVVAGVVTSVSLAGWGTARIGRGHPVPVDLGRPGEVLPRQALLVLAVGGGLAAASATALGVFAVDSGVAAGLSASSAGYLLAVCSAVSLVGRVAFGWLFDRVRGRSLYVTTANLMLGTVAGMLLLAVGHSVELFVVGAVIAYAGWTWPGLYHLAIVRDSQGAVASATGVILAGLSLGAAAGPLTIGLIAEAVSYEAAWLLAAMVGIAGAVTTRYGRRIIRRDRGMPVRPLTVGWRTTVRDRGRLHRQQFGAHPVAVPVGAVNELAVAFEPGELELHRDREVLPTLTARGCPHLLQHLQRIVGVLRSPRLPRLVRNRSPSPGREVRGRDQTTPCVVTRPARHVRDRVQDAALVRLFTVEGAGRDVVLGASVKWPR